MAQLSFYELIIFFSSIWADLQYFFISCWQSCCHAGKVVVMEENGACGVEVLKLTISTTKNLICVGIGLRTV